MTYGIGEWRMRNGGKAVVGMMLGANPYKLQGHIDGSYCTWTTAGRVFRSREDPHDLVAPWEEPAPDPIGDKTIIAVKHASGINFKVGERGVTSINLCDNGTAIAVMRGDFLAEKLPIRYMDLEYAAAPADPIDFDPEAHLTRQREFSLKTFGPGPRTKGVSDHIRKELKEIADNPLDLKEWVDVILLAFDGAWRAGWEPKDIIAAIVAKQTKNEARDWPDWRTADPDKAIEHIRDGEQPQ